MDQTDIRIIQLLFDNSRISYQDLAEKVSLSTPTVFKRVQALVDHNIITGFNAKVSSSYLGYTILHIYGTSKKGSFSDIIPDLDRDKYTSMIHMSGGGYLHIGAILRGMDEIDQYLEYIKEKTQISLEKVGIFGIGAEKEENGIQSPIEYQISDSDMKIIRSISKDSRKSLSDIAKEVGISSKTVHKRLAKMIENNVLELSISLDFAFSNDIVSLFHIFLEDKINKNEFYLKIRHKYFPNIIASTLYYDIPQFILSLVLTESMKEIEDLKSMLENEEGVKEIMPCPIYSAYHFDTWLERLEF